MKNRTDQAQNAQNTPAKITDDQSIDVLYQKMGDRWFAFSMVDDEVFVGSIPVDELTRADKKNRGNS